MPRGQKVEIDPKTFEGLCRIQCTKQEVACVLGCSHDTVERFCKRHYKMTFEEAREVHGANGKASLRRTQFKLAEKSAAMAIFLGKQYLGQTDKIAYDNNDALDRLDAILGGLKANAAKTGTESETK